MIPAALRSVVRRVGGPFRRPRRADLEEGFSLLEVVIAFALLMIVMIPTAVFMSDETTTTGSLRNRVVAANLVDQMLESYQQQASTSAGFTTLSSGADQGATSSTQTVGGVTYTLTTTKQWQSTSVAAGDCASNGNGSSATASTALLFIEASVSWHNMGGTPPVVATTTVAQPYGSGSTSSGSLELSVSGATGGGSANVPVTLTNQDSGATYSYVTDANGCLFVPGLPPSPASSPKGYTITLAEAGWVDPQENTTVTDSSVLIGGGSVTSVSNLQYDQGGTIAVTYTGGTPPTGMPVTVHNNNLKVVGGILAPAPGTNTAVGPLYPYTDGYNYWLGDCSDNAPSGGGPLAVPTAW